MKAEEFLIKIIKENDLLQYLTIDELKEINKKAMDRGWLK